jgi:hypothetical protein
MMPALDTRNCPHHPCWLSADRADACVIMPDCSAIRNPKTQILIGKNARSSFTPPICSCYQAIPTALPLPFKTHPLEPAAKSP